MLFKSMLLALVASTTLGTTAAQAVNLVQNGDFETTTNGPGQVDSKTVATGWTSTGFNFLFGEGTADTSGAIGDLGVLHLWGLNNGGDAVLSASPTGGNFIGADGAFGVAPVQQTITGLTVGTRYVLTFDWAGAQQSGFTGVTTEQFKVSLGDQQFDTAVLTNASHGFTGWQHETFTFTAGAATQVLSFLAVGTPNGEPPFSLLDGVSLTAAVPEPASWALMIAGFGFIGVASRARRNSGAVVTA